MLNVPFLKKELREYFKTSKFLILMLLFLFFAIMSPLLARYMNELLGLISTDIDIVLPAPTVTDAWAQYYKNMTSLCLIVFLIVMTGSVAQEKNKGSIMLVLTKKVSRFDFICGKFLAGALIFTACYLASLLVSGVYTYILFDTFSYSGLTVSLVLLWLLGLFYIGLAILASVLSKTPTIAALMGFAGFAVLNLLNIVTPVQKFNPAGAASLVNGILAGTATQGADWICLISTSVGIAAVFFASYVVFKKQEI